LIPVGEAVGRKLYFEEHFYEFNVSSAIECSDKKG
jgi:hypothetical protein